MALVEGVEKLNYFMSHFSEVMRGVWDKIIGFFAATPPWLRITLQITSTVLIIALIISIIIFMYKRRNAWIYKC